MGVYSTKYAYNKRYYLIEIVEIILLLPVFSIDKINICIFFIYISYIQSGDTSFREITFSHSSKYISKLNNYTVDYIIYTLIYKYQKSFFLFQNKNELIFCWTVTIIILQYTYNIKPLLGRMFVFICTLSSIGSFFAEIIR